MRRRLLLPALIALVVGCLDRPPVAPPAPSDPDAPTEPRFGRAFDPRSDSLRSPVRIALTPAGNLLVSDSRLHMILDIDGGTLQPRSTMPVDGTPLAVAISGGRIFVGNATSRQVEVYNATGRFWYAFAPPVAYPTDIAVDGRLGLVFVVDAEAKDIKVFSTTGELRRVISGPAAAPDAQLHVPTGITLDPERQEVLVSDYPDPATGGSATVRIFDYQGTLLQVLSPGRCGSLGCSAGFSRPQGIAVDDRGRIYVTDALLAAVLVFNRDTLALVKTLGGRNVGPPVLRVPLDVVIGKNGDVFVTSNRTAAVEVFRRGTLP